MRHVQVAHWHQYFDNLSVTPTHFYENFRTEFNTRKIPSTTISHVNFLEANVLSDKRLYLQIDRDWLRYHVCVAPFGTGFFVSSRLLISPWKTWPVLVVTAAIFVFTV